MEVPAGYSKEDLVDFRSVASKDFRAFVPLIDEYLRFAERADTEVVSETARLSSRRFSKAGSESMHLFDMLRDKRLFPSNSDLSEFAARILPGMSHYRYDKMSRGDIASRIIEYLETRDKKTRQGLETSMREAMVSTPEKAADRKSFFTKWEKIIKGIEF
ncbi:hypothetical protein [Occallatibacter riparius]|uniref:Uncharacterized protein n=1 Tax=Occallatibacter riparius TaxID=1002689 RepID=A0A9J7BR11_9BACT|nr:hypothetical protein [Occallatibacter riparius]UWZ83374.1 hypothetical protein MOP44_22750 [Occallatibacter riparius]